MSSRWLDIDEEKSYEEVISCRKTGELELLGKCLYMRKCKQRSMVNKQIFERETLP